MFSYIQYIHSLYSDICQNADEMTTVYTTQ